MCNRYLHILCGSYKVKFSKVPENEIVYYIVYLSAKYFNRNVCLSKGPSSLFSFLYIQD